jgi:hypothetical protein
MQQQGQSLEDRAALQQLGHLRILRKPTSGTLSIRFGLRAGSSVIRKRVFGIRRNRDFRWFQRIVPAIGSPNYRRFIGAPAFGVVN